jgi:ABC-type methionine transport system ATPase subunit
MTVEKIGVSALSVSRPDSSVPGGQCTRRVLDDVSFSVRCGEVYGIIGPSGSGKTSLLRTLNGLDSPSSGSVLLDGVDVLSLDPIALRRRVGMVFQVPALFAGTVGSNVEYPLSLLDMAGGERELRGRACLDLVGLPGDFWGRTASELSLGEQQRVSIARSLANEPEVLLLDEPTSALDPTSSGTILSLVRRLNAETGMAVVFVTHLLEQAKAVCSRALVLVNGRTVEEGPISEILGAPKSETGRAFVEGRLNPHAGAEVGDAGSGQPGRRGPASGGRE